MTDLGPGLRLRGGLEVVSHLHPVVAPRLVLSHPGFKLLSHSRDEPSSNKQALNGHLKKLSSGRNVWSSGEILTHDT